MSLQTMNRVWNDRKTTGSHRLALLALADRSDEDGICWPGVQWIAQRTNVSDRQIRTILRDLEASGHLLTIAGKGGRSCTNLYIVTAGLTPTDIDDIFARRKELERINPEVQREKPGSPASQNPEVQREKPGSPARKPGSPARETRKPTSAEPVDPINHQLEPPVVAAAATAAAVKPPATQPPTRNRKTDQEWDALCRTYENEIGLLTEIVEKHLAELAAQYPAQWITDAIAESVRFNVRKLSYIGSILRRWHTEGRETVNANRNYAPTTYHNGKSSTPGRDNSPARRDNGLSVQVPEDDYERVEALLAGKPWPPIAPAQSG